MGLRNLGILFPVFFLPHPEGIVCDVQTAVVGEILAEAKSAVGVALAQNDYKYLHVIHLYLQISSSVITFANR